MAPDPDDRPLKVGLLTHSVNPRGGVVHTLELARALHAAGHAPTVIAPGRAGQEFFRAVPFRTLVVPIEAPAGPGLVAAVGSRIAALRQALSALVRHEPFDVLHTHDPIGGNALADLVDAGRIARFVRTVHHLEEYDAPQLMHWQARGFERAAQVFCVSRHWRERLGREHGVAAVEVGNGVDPRRYAPAARPGDADLAIRLGVRRGAPVVLAVGGVEERKNTHRLLHAFVLLRRERPSAQLVIAGGASVLDHAAYRQAFDALARSAGLAVGRGEPVLLTGTLDDADLPGLYRLADVVAMPSLNEGFGLVVLEALASGVPVVVSRRAPFTDHLHEGDAHWADPHDPASIAAALTQALEARDPVRIAATAARLGARYSWAASAATHLLEYRRGLRAHPSTDLTETCHARHALPPALAR